MEPITADILLEKWPNFKDSSFRSFIKLLDVSEIEKEIWRQENPHSIFSFSYLRPLLKPEEVKTLPEKLYGQRLEEIMKHELYKMFFLGEEFTDIIQWLRSRKEYDYGHPKVHIKIMYIISLSLMGYAETLRKGSVSKVQKTNKYKSIQTTAKKLKDQIESLGYYTDHALHDCIKTISPCLEYLAIHEPVKELRSDDTYSERHFLETLLYWFEIQNISPMPALIKKILDFAGMPNLGLNDRNLRANIKSCNERRLKKHNKAMAWYLIKPNRS